MLMQLRHVKVVQFLGLFQGPTSKFIITEFLSIF